MLLSLFLSNTEAQVITGNYTAFGYFFHPTQPRYFNQSAPLALISGTTYEVSLADLAGYSFRFTVDGTNHLVNWTPTGSTPAIPSSGFMTADNPGNIIYTATPGPGTTPYIQSTYNNTYDPATHTFYLHYGYGVGSSDQTGYSRQVYEKLGYSPTPTISSVSPLSGNILTPVTIRGHNFIGADATGAVSFGTAPADSAAILSDSVIIAWPGFGASGDVAVVNQLQQVNFPGFTYNPINVSPDPQWQVLGGVGLSPNAIGAAIITTDHNSIPYISFYDTLTHKGMVMKYAAGAWLNVGAAVSNTLYVSARMVIDNNNNPVLAYKDSAAGFINVKRFDGSNWIDLLLPPAKSTFAMAIDRDNVIYLASLSSTGAFTANINISRYNGSGWNVTSAIAATYYGNLDLTVDSITNIPYVVFADAVTQQATVMKLSAGVWSTVGTPGFSTAPRGIWDPVIQIDRSSNPVVLFQEDNGFERLSAYKFAAGTWSQAGAPYFSKGHSYHSSFALDRNGDLFTLFQDATYNNAWTVKSFKAPTYTWDTVGRRGSIPGVPYVKSLAIAPNNSVFIVYTDTAHGSKATVLKLNNPCYTNTNVWTGAVNQAWENPGNWQCGYVPQGYSTVVIGAGATVVLNSNTTIQTLIVQGGNLTVSPGIVLTVTSP